MLALPVIGWNAFGSFTISNDLQSFDSKEPKITDFVTGAIVVQPYLTHLKPFQLSARDDRIKDCLRSGNCKN
jgi:hypothetical protein